MTLSRRHFLRTAAGLIPVCAAAALAGCGRGSANPGAASAPAQPLYDPVLAHNPWKITPLDAPKGEDYPISWQNTALEQAVRRWLDRPFGDVMHSDVWDIRFVSIGVGVGTSTVCLFEQPVDGVAFTTSEAGYRDDGIVEGVSFDGDPLTSLQDLCHFNSLQALTLSLMAFDHEPRIDLRGLETCRNLSMLRVTPRYEPVSLEPLAACTALEFLEVSGGDALDLTPLAACTKLTRLKLGNTNILSLEPVADLPLIHLDLCNSLGSETINDGLDYSPIARMTQLRYLDLTNNPTFTDASLCVGLEQLELLYLRNLHWDTPATYRELQQLLPHIENIWV